jgi:hypothetical protein
MGFITVCSLQGYGQYVGLGMRGNSKEIYTPIARMTRGHSAHRVEVEYLGRCTFWRRGWAKTPKWAWDREALRHRKCPHHRH